MKVARASLRNFKRFQNLELDIRNRATGDVASTFLIIGDNGTGKTTVLQAIALCLSMAAGTTRSVREFDWLGWVPGRFERWGRPVIELEVHFTGDEIEATRQAALRWFRSRERVTEEQPFVEPGDSPVVTVRMDGEHFEAGTREQLYQLRGRSYAAQLLRTDHTARELFDRLPGVFWFDQFRNLASPPNEEGADENGQGRVGFQVGVARLRQHLNRWQMAKIGGRWGPRDFLQELENLYRAVFSGRSFGLPEPMYRGGVPTPDDYYFMLNDGNRTYDIEEMSAGEQSVFPLLYEAVRLQFRHSIILLDEVDLNLHPPLAQALVRALPRIGPECQFFLTTHSEAVASIISPEQTYRLPGGRLCL
jgi:energy-coupling factor transporter ATP-binding protein EcfA2